MQRTTKENKPFAGIKKSTDLEAMRARIDVLERLFQEPLSVAENRARRTEYRGLLARVAELESIMYSTLEEEIDDMISSLAREARQSDSDLQVTSELAVHLVKLFELTESPFLSDSAKVAIFEEIRRIGRNIT